ncbi:uncharacterized protein Z518_09555 [Rhinocladiella mackenziei CBS 650.93]|uniref:Rhinocladiella mackenziei CBS 650.93 unplaced genomic scaffold supercont1.7, whole genome shotgun sequence n=1 Tax=Rhinocladiella mackenziei CBS 650.93 TaxID=1442369 RepID=A0A0D2GU05_9EURO|nr:uncharacterized protein Z518_09555 [Rhinocladiella mackenziei CBS 650.93]KIX01828.1 hypothetical protein Z518_09555 [Rhinocladiella mackenziei CBS 650.93]
MASVIEIQSSASAQDQEMPTKTAPARFLGKQSQQEDEDMEMAKVGAIVADSNIPSGAARAEAMQLIWGRHGRLIVWLGICMMLLVYQFDNALLYNYRNYAASNFNNVAGLGTLAVAGNIVFAVSKPPIAKISNVIGRAEAYVFCILCYLLGYILCASSSSFGVYAGGFIFANIGQTGVNILNDIIIADVTSMRSRAFAIAISFFPFLVTPWISAFIVEDVVEPGGIGWRWGIGMFAIIMPVAALALVGPLLYYQHRAKKMSVILTTKTTLRDFCSQIDLGGSFLLAAGFAMFLIPFSLAGTTPSRWDTDYVIALIVVGAVTLVGLVFYEGYVATHPILPARYFKNLSIVICSSLGFLDTLGFQVTHTYLYTWSVITHDMGPRDATFLQYTNGVWQCLIGIIAGAIMYKTRRYKWLMVIGTVIKLIGFGVMLRLRGADNSWAELFVVQSIQGWGSGIIEIGIIVGAQVVVSHMEMPQVTALVLLATFVGASVGNSIAGGIYSGTFKDALRHHLGSQVTDAIVNSVFESITSPDIPAPGTTQRTAINLAYSDVLRYATYAAVGTSAVCVVLAFFLPNLQLNDGQSLVSRGAENQEEDERSDVQQRTGEDNDNTGTGTETGEAEAHTPTI